ncbi:DUF1552 domain-containing protein [Planctomyces sp. SH-PL14]|uniref:DUF1552 domain-containing protein n=1 Tax=Planctomyces sp. SH-PL14 TaxID=1632864 RepID=UPI00078EBAF7|nr:DUF1552 domain-containing protein [Planctomyces sp. SH-PL14]AMV21885.1 hypothetical protein VT03_28545 [Planctomyces sp. SH-PL14]
MALPWLEAMGPRSAFAAPASKSPLRMAFLYVPNGKQMDAWTPAKTGALELTKTLEPLAAVREKITVMTGLAQRKAFANGDGGGDHARALSTFLTGTQAKKTDGADIRAGISIDQIAAQSVGKHTRFPSLEIGCDAGAQSGNCDSGYSCAYSSSISWRSPTQPVPKETNPQYVFERLFTNGRVGETTAQRARRQKYQKSILDFVQEDATRLQTQLGMADRRKLDEYLSAVRELEIRIEKAGKSQGGNLVDRPAPVGIPDSFEEHIQLLGDLMILAFQTDVTRISTFVFSNEGSGRSFSFIGVPEGHHDLSHHESKEEKRNKLKQIDLFHTKQLAYILGKMDGIKEAGGTMLDNTMLVYGSGIGDGNRHNHDDLPIVLAGRAGGRLKGGEHVKFGKEVPLTNLYLTMLDWMGVPCEKLGDSTERLKGMA